MKITSKASLFLVLAALCAAGCATPPGTPMPKPTDYQELTHAQSVFERYSRVFANDPDVTSVLLSSNNNPRNLVVHVKDNAAQRRLLKKFTGTIEGVDTRYYVDREGPQPDDPIEAVPTVAAPTTWWGKVMAVFEGWRTRIMMPNTASTPIPSVAPNAPGVKNI